VAVEPRKRMSAASRGGYQSLSIQLYDTITPSFFIPTRTLCPCRWSQ